MDEQHPHYGLLKQHQTETLWYIVTVAVRHSITELHPE